MATPIKILGGESEIAATVYPDKSLRVAQTVCPPIEEQKNIVFRQYLTADGTPSGSEDMKVDGSVTPVEFWVPASQEGDRYISYVSFMLADAGATLNDFGSLGGALANGCLFFYERLDRTVIIHEGIQTNFMLVRMCLIQPAFGSGVQSVRLPNVIGNSEAFVPVFPARGIMPPFGIKLDQGSRQRLVFRIRDNIAALDGFNAIAYGFDRLAD